jgi:hypothetical protein
MRSPKKAATAVVVPSRGADRLGHETPCRVLIRLEICRGKPSASTLFAETIEARPEQARGASGVTTVSSENSRLGRSRATSYEAASAGLGRGKGGDQPLRRAASACSRAHPRQGGSRRRARWPPWRRLTILSGRCRTRSMPRASTASSEYRAVMWVGGGGRSGCGPLPWRAGRRRGRPPPRR